MKTQVINLFNALSARVFSKNNFRHIDVEKFIYSDAVLTQKTSLPNKSTDLIPVELFYTKDSLFFCIASCCISLARLLVKSNFSLVVRSVPEMQMNKDCDGIKTQYVIRGRFLTKKGVV